MSLDSPSVSVVIVSHNEGAQLGKTVHAILSTLPARGEIVVVDDQSSDGSADAVAGRYPWVRVLRPEKRLGAAPARNWGAQAACGDILVFSDAHVQPSRNWGLLVELARANEQIGIVVPTVSVMNATGNKGYGMAWKDASLDVDWLGYAGKEPYPVPLAPGCFLVMRRAVWQELHGFDGGLRIWGMEDSELSLRTWLLGYENWIVPRVEVAHLFRTRHPYRVDWATILHNILRVAMVHFNAARMQRVVEHFATQASFSEALARLVNGDVWEQREWMRAHRRFDDDWFFTRFGISC